MNNSIRRYKYLFDAIGVQTLASDEIIPDGKQHLVHIIDNDMNAEKPIIGVSLTGSQWDLLWWVYRLDDETNVSQTFGEFLQSFLILLYNKKFKQA